MANVVHFLFGMVVDELEDGGEVVVGHVLESEFPELFIFIRVVLDMLSGVLVAPAITQPDVISLVRKHEGRRFAFIIDDPCIRRIDQSVLHENGFEALLDLGAFLLDSVNGQDVPVLSGHFVGLVRILEISAVLFEFELGLAMAC